MESDMDFGELSNDENLKARFINFRRDAEAASKMLETFFDTFKYDELSAEDKVRYDLFLAFAINSYFWMYLRTRGIDPNQHDIKFQINRVRDYMNRSKQIYEKKTLMPKLDQGAAKRFVRSGLWDPKNPSRTHTETTKPTLLKRKRDETEEEEKI